MVAAWDWCILLLRISPVADSRIYVSDFKLFVACKPSTRTPIFLFFSLSFSPETADLRMKTCRVSVAVFVPWLDLGGQQCI